MQAIARDRSWEMRTPAIRSSELKGEIKRCGDALVLNSRGAEVATSARESEQSELVSVTAGASDSSLYALIAVSRREHLNCIPFRQSDDGLPHIVQHFVMKTIVDLI